MSDFIKENRQPYTDLATVESQRNDLTAEEFPEGPYGSDKITESLGKANRGESTSVHPIDSIMRIASCTRVLNATILLRTAM